MVHCRAAGHDTVNIPAGKRQGRELRKVRTRRGLGLSRSSNWSDRIGHRSSRWPGGPSRRRDCSAEPTPAPTAMPTAIPTARLPMAAPKPAPIAVPTAIPVPMRFTCLFATGSTSSKNGTSKCDPEPDQCSSEQFAIGNALRSWMQKRRQACQSLAPFSSIACNR